MSVKALVTCDYCGRDLKENERVNAQVYGADFHIDCVTRMSAVMMLKLLSLDEIRFKGDKFIFTREFKRLLNDDPTSIVADPSAE